MTARKANGSGTIYQRKSDKRWAGSLYVTEADGRRVRRTIYGKTRKEVEQQIVELRSKAESGVAMTPSRLNLSTYLEEWLTQIVAPRVRPNTLAAYRFHVERYLVPDLGQQKLGKLTARQVRLYLDSLKHRGRGVRTIRYVHATLRAALEDAMREELLEKNVAKLVRPPSSPRQERHPLSVEEIRMFLKATSEERLHALYVVIALLGLRRSEALGLQWRDVDLDVGTLSVQRGLHRIGGRLQVMDTKTVRSQRTIPLPEPVRLVLAAHKVQQEHERVELAERWPSSGHVFTTAIGTPIDPDNCSKAVKAALERSGVRTVRMHDFRH